MDASAKVRGARTGFTLVEMLVVIVIIGILASFILGAVIHARQTARKAVIRTEVSQFQTSLDNYRTEYGEYPADFFGINHPTPEIRLQARNDVIRHLRKAFPRYVPGQIRKQGTNPNPDGRLDNSDFEEFANDVYYAYNRAIDPLYFDPASALMFFLCGLPDGVSGDMTPAGFHADPTMPFKPGRPRTELLFEVDPERFAASEPDPFDNTRKRYMRFYPADVLDAAPYVYFKSRRCRFSGGRYEYGWPDDDDPSQATQLVPAYYMHGPGMGENVCAPCLDEYPGDAPYWDDSTNPPPQPDNVSPSDGLTDFNYIRRWRDPEKYQVHSCGVRGRYGNVTIDPANPVDPATTITKERFRFTKTGENLSRDVHDDVTSFTKKSLEDEM